MRDLIIALVVVVVALSLVIGSIGYFLSELEAIDKKTFTRIPEHVPEMVLKPY